ncbi:hypothetical protein QC761_511840 [Podospora bellae-mahoneyi]|uniref:Uncharacterized protein n=1 Tax=Podospora bellae-mahoneyi TaxID=2093777 RepID=A0ABR0FDN3_9PEZI|nr:hypothetical protein QC761_511840 [Podospora bellae-mahoneyi]
MELDFPASGTEAAVDGQPFAIVNLSITRLRIVVSSLSLPQINSSLQLSVLLRHESGAQPPHPISTSWPDRACLPAMDTGMISDDTDTEEASQKPSKNISA